MQRLLKCVLLGFMSVCFNMKLHAEVPVYVWTDTAGAQLGQNCQPTQPLVNGLEAYLEGVIEVVHLESHLPSALPLSGKFLQVVDANGQLSAVSCAGNDPKSYLLFDVFSPEQLTPVARLGVHASQIELFRQVRLHSAEDAEVQIAAPFSVAPSSRLIEGVTAIDGSLNQVICTTSSQLNVRDESLNKILFTVPRFSDVKVVQSWDQQDKKKVVNSKSYTFIRVQFSARPTGKNEGWVAESYVTVRSNCPGAVATPQPLPIASTWQFPTNKRPSSNYKTGMRRFQASRGGGSRYHAACDLYRVKDEAAVAVTAGEVIRDKYYFYQGTYALEVRHTGGRVVRYGEITGKKATGVSAGRSVKAGQTIGYIGKVNSGCCTPMLHFEMYSGTATGSLTQSGNKFQRRKDLLDPSADLTHWEKLKFGQAY